MSTPESERLSCPLSSSPDVMDVIKICGLCSHRGEDLIPMEADLVEFLTYFLRLKEEELPGRVCVPCYRSVLESHNFHRQCRRAMEKLATKNFLASMLLGQEEKQVHQNKQSTTAVPSMVTSLTDPTIASDEQDALSNPSMSRTTRSSIRTAPVPTTMIDLPHDVVTRTDSDETKSDISGYQNVRVFITYKDIKQANQAFSNGGCILYKKGRVVIAKIWPEKTQPPARSTAKSAPSHASVMSEAGETSTSDLVPLPSPPLSTSNWPPASRPSSSPGRMTLSGRITRSNRDDRSFYKEEDGSLRSPLHPNDRSTIAQPPTKKLRLEQMSPGDLQGASSMDEEDQVKSATQRPPPRDKKPQLKKTSKKATQRTHLKEKKPRLEKPSKKKTQPEPTSKKAAPKPPSDKKPRLEKASKKATQRVSPKDKKPQPEPTSKKAPHRASSLDKKLRPELVSKKATQRAPLIDDIALPQLMSQKTAQRTPPPDKMPELELMSKKGAPRASPMDKKPRPVAASKKTALKKFQSWTASRKAAETSRPPVKKPRPGTASRKQSTPSASICTEIAHELSPTLGPVSSGTEVVQEPSATLVSAGASTGSIASIVQGSAATLGPPGASAEVAQGSSTTMAPAGARTGLNAEVVQGSAATFWPAGPSGEIVQPPATYWPTGRPGTSAELSQKPSGALGSAGTSTELAQEPAATLGPAGTSSGLSVMVTHGPPAAVGPTGISAYASAVLAQDFPSTLGSTGANVYSSAVVTQELPTTLEHAGGSTGGGSMVTEEYPVFVGSASGAATAATAKRSQLEEALTAERTPSRKGASSIRATTVKKPGGRKRPTANNEVPLEEMVVPASIASGFQQGNTGEESDEEVFPSVGPYQCEICQVITVTKQEFVDHITKFHLEVVDLDVLRSLENDLAKKKKRERESSCNGSTNDEDHSKVENMASVPMEKPAMMVAQASFESVKDPLMNEGAEEEKWKASVTKKYEEENKIVSSSPDPPATSFKEVSV